MRNSRVVMISFIIFIIFIAMNLYISFVPSESVFENIETSTSIKIEADVIEVRRYEFHPNSYNAELFTLEYTLSNGEIYERSFVIEKPDYVSGSSFSKVYIYVYEETYEPILIELQNTSSSMLNTAFSGIFSTLSPMLIFFVGFFVLRFVTKKVNAKNTKVSTSQSDDYTYQDSLFVKDYKVEEKKYDDPFNTDDSKYNIEKDDPFADFYKKNK